MNKKALIRILGIVILILIITILTLMFYPLYCRNFGSTHDLLLTYSITVDSEESEYFEVGSVAGEGLIATLIKGKKVTQPTLRVSSTYTIGDSRPTATPNIF